MTRLLRILTVTGVASCLFMGDAGKYTVWRRALPAGRCRRLPARPTPTFRTAGWPDLEAYVTNGDPTAPLKG